MYVMETNVIRMNVKQRLNVMVMMDSWMKKEARYRIGTKEKDMQTSALEDTTINTFDTEL